jgi:antitoxin FitA
VAVSLSIKNVPDDVVAQLRANAERNHRSLQGELLSIVTNPRVLRGEEDGAGDWRDGPADLAAVLAEIRASGLRTPDEATAMIREDRDSDHGRR